MSLEQKDIYSLIENDFDRRKPVHLACLYLIKDLERLGFSHPYLKDPEKLYQAIKKIQKNSLYYSTPEALMENINLEHI